MMPHENCGIVGIVARRGIVRDIYFGLRAIQHRGQESAGIATYLHGIKCIKGMGLVHEVFSEDVIKSIPGNIGIGHVRYSTTGSSSIENAQPVVASSVFGEIALAHNGDIINANNIKKELEAEGWAFITSTDSEVLIRIFANELAKTKNPIKSAYGLQEIIKGSYSAVVLMKDKLFAIRDPYGIKPLSLGRLQNREGYVVASETVVFDVLNAEFIRDVFPGEILEISPAGISSYLSKDNVPPAHCMFEWVYFARPDGMICGKSVYDVRLEVGRTLAKEHPVDADAVIPVPDSGRTHALGYSEVSGIPYVEGLMKNRYIGRTFIIPSQESRDLNVHLKLNPIKSVIKGKRIVLVDDSIVRGTTMKKIVQIIRKAGAKEVHLRIGCPPIISPCYFGIDMKSREQFIATGRTCEEIGRRMAADSIGYLSVDGLIKCIGLPKEHLCLGCITGEYPMEIPGEKMRFQKRLEEFNYNLL